MVEILKVRIEMKFHFETNTTFYISFIDFFKVNMIG